MINAHDVGYAVDQRWLVSGVQIALAPGRLVIIIGPNGAGKSTLLRMLTGELKPSVGNIRIGHRDLHDFSPAELSRVRAVVPQHSHLAFPFSVIEVVQLGLTVPGFMRHGPRSRRLADIMLDRVGLLPLAAHSYQTLSGGERQRVHIARALCQMEAAAEGEAFRALLVDEPTSSLDIAHQLSVVRELRRQADNGCIVVAVLHDLNLSAAYADELLLLANGEQKAFGPPAAVLSDELLSRSYNCDVRLNALPRDGSPFLLPQACAIASGRWA